VVTLARRLLPLASVALLLSALVAPASTAAPGSEPEPRRIGTVVSHDCRNLAVVVDLDQAQQERAAALLPDGFRLTERPTLLVESSTCRRATVNGTRIGRFSLSESALSIEPPRSIGSRQLTEISANDIYMLSQLDTDRRLSSFKKRAGYPSEVTRIRIDLANPLLPRVASASAGGTIAPTSVTVVLSPQLVPDPLMLPNPGVVYKLWAKAERGRVVATTNSNLAVGAAAFGFGTVSVPRRSLLGRLLGGTTAYGYAFSGSATGFVNDTYRWPR